MSHWSSKTKNAKSARDLRHEEPRDKRHLSPHQKPRKYRLTVKYTQTVTETLIKDFHTKASMQDFRAGIEREIAKMKMQSKRGRTRWWGISWNTPFKMQGIEHSEFKTGPEFMEEMIEEN